MTFSCAFFSLRVGGGCLVASKEIINSNLHGHCVLQELKNHHLKVGTMDPSIFARPPYMQPLLVAMHLQSAKLLDAVFFGCRTMDVDLPAPH